MTGLTVLGAVFACCGFALALVVLRAADAYQQRRSLVGVDLRFGRGQDEAGVQAFVGSVSGLLPPWWRRWWHTPFIVCEVHADRHGTRHRLLVPQRLLRGIESSLAAHLPAVHYAVQTEIAYPLVDGGTEYRLTNAERSLAIDNTGALSARLLASLQPLHGDEAVIVQCLLAPARPVGPARLATPAEREHELTLDDGVVVTSEAVAALKKKRSRPLLLTCLRVAAHADSKQRRRALVRDVEATFHATRAPGTLLKRRLMRSTIAAQRLVSVWVPLKESFRNNVSI